MKFVRTLLPRACLKILMDAAAGLLPVACVGSAVTARYGDAPASPPWPRPKSLASASIRIFRQTLTLLFLIGASASAQSLSQSKLSIHLINNYSVGSSNIVSGKPRVLKVLAHTNGFPSGMLASMRDYKARVPGGKLLVRVYSPKHYFLSDNPTASAADYWTNHLQSALNTLSPADKALIDYLEGPNEGDTPTLGYPNGTNALASSQWFNEFWTNLTPRIVSAGLKPCLGSIAVGNPGSLSDLDPFIPALRQAKAVGGAWSYHAYTIHYTTDVGVEMWYSLRYRQFYNYFAQHYPDLVDMPLVLTEGGVDFNGTPGTSGWQARGPASHYQRWLNWFDRRMLEDSYLLGCTLFQNGDPSGWSSFEIEPIANWLGSYLTNPTDFPPAPTGLSATVVDGNVQLNWTSIPTTPLTYTVKRASTNGSPLITLATGIAEGVSATTFTDTSPWRDRPSRYVVSAVSAFGESDNSAEVQITVNPITSVPAAPSNLTASVGSGHIALQWTIPAGAASFNVKRALSSGGPYTIIASNFYAASFKNCSYPVNLPSYYVVSAVNSLGESPNSSQVAATPTNALPDAIVTALFWTNTSIGAGSSVHFRVTVKNQGSASIPANQLGIGFLVNGSQVSYVGAGNSTLAAGASATYIANGGGSSGAWLATIGNHTITAVADDINRFAEGNEENNAFSVPLSVYVSGYSVNCGGSAVGTFATDAYFSGSTNLSSVANTIDLTGASNAAPQSVYQSERWGPSKYNFPNLVPGKLYKTRLHFVETSPSVTQAGDRRFNVSINGAQVLSGFDVFAAAGAKFRAVTQPFNIAADSGGNIALHFARGAANEPKINGIQIIPYTNTAPVLAAIGNKTINAGATLIFTNTATDADLPADTLTFSLTNSPPGSSVNATSGIFSWTPPPVSTTTTNAITVVVSDNGSPALSNTKTFNVILVAPPKISSISSINENVHLTWQTFPGKTYRVEFKSHLNETNWAILGNEAVSAGTSLSTTNNVYGNQQRFYRIVQLD